MNLYDNDNYRVTIDRATLKVLTDPGIEVFEDDDKANLITLGFINGVATLYRTLTGEEE